MKGQSKRAKLNKKSKKKSKKKGKGADVDGEGTREEWLLGQLALRQQRLGLLSASLDEAGFETPKLTRKGPPVKVAKGWDCALAPDDEGEDEDEDELGLGAGTGDAYPCLIMGEVLPGYKCVAPQGTGKWVTLWELNRMRRHEPEKISGLWYDQFSLDCSALTAYAGPPGYALAFLLDHRAALRSVIALACAVGCVVLRKPLAFCLVKLLASKTVWVQYLNWSRIVYAPLPAKLYFVGVFWREVLVKYGGMLEQAVRGRLVDAECDLLDYATPVSS